MDSRDNPQTNKNRCFGQSVRHALDGIRELFTLERNFRIEFCVAVMAVLLGLLFQISPAEWCWVVLAVILVFGAEVVNTVFEYLVDLLVGRRYNVIAKRIKDVAAGGVLMTAVLAFVIGGLIFVPRIISWF